MLKVKFWQIENIVLMRVLEQDEETREKGTLYEDEDIKIKSCKYPDIKEECLYIRGQLRNYDTNICCYGFDDCDDAQEYIEKATKAIHAYNIKTGKAKENTADIEIKTVIAE